MYQINIITSGKSYGMYSFSLFFCDWYDNRPSENFPLSNCSNWLREPASDDDEKSSGMNEMLPSDQHCKRIRYKCTLIKLHSTPVDDICQLTNHPFIVIIITTTTTTTIDGVVVAIVVILITTTTNIKP